MTFSKFLKAIPISIRVSLLLIISWCILLLGAESGVAWSVLWLPLRNVPLDTQPHDKLSATRLALTVARVADCGNFEPQGYNQDFAYFTCDTDVGGKMPKSYGLYIFYGEATKIKFINKFKPGGEYSKPIFSKQGKQVEVKVPIKSGSYYMISGGSFHKHLAADFPGETINLEQHANP